jgi:predicted aspartyl protease/tetratricopeptide (TPR) repeat protein
MKVKGIESQYSEIGAGNPLAGRSLACIENPYHRVSIPRSSANNLRHLIAILLLIALTLGAVPHALAARADDTEDKQREAKDRILREARKALRGGKNEKAISLYRELIDKDPQDIQAQVGISLAYFKDQNYLLCFSHAAEAIKLNESNARAHALAGLALLRSGLVRAAVPELQRAIGLDPKDPLAYGGAAEVDYFEGRIKESRSKALYAHRLDPDEPDYVLIYARSSSREEDFKEAADAYEVFLQIAPESDSERRDRIKGLIQFYRQLTGVRVHQLTGANLAEIPFRLGSDRRPYIKVKVNGRDALFVVDTGSGFMVVSKDSAKRLRIPEIARGGKSQGIGGDGKFHIVYGLLDSLQLGGIKLRQIPCFIRAFHGMGERPADERADGFIGLSVLSHFLTELNYKDNRMVLDRAVNRPVPAAVLPGSTVVPFRTTQNGLISIETEFDGTNPINAILDSGASSTAISLVAVERHKMRDQIIKGQTANVIGAAGVTNNVEMLFIRNCRVADLKQSNMRALVLDFGAINETSGFEQSGILGGDFLRHFRITIDFEHAQVTFNPHSTAVTKQ